VIQRDEEGCSDAVAHAGEVRHLDVGTRWRFVLPTSACAQSIMTACLDYPVDADRA